MRNQDTMLSQRRAFYRAATAAKHAARQQVNYALAAIQAAAGNLLMPGNPMDSTALQQTAATEEQLQAIEVAIAQYRANINKAG